MTQHDDLRTRLGEAAHAPLAWADGSAELAAIEAHASEGCSVCARALVNGREMAVDLAVTAAPAEPAPRARDALLDRARGLLAGRRARAAATGSAISVPGAKPRVLDSSAAVATLHARSPNEPARIREIDDLRAPEAPPGDGTERLLAQVARFIDFTLFFVSVVRGERVTYRAQRGLAPELAAFRDLRREMSYCTHCVSAEAPLVVENAAVEPFFRGNKAVTRFGIAAYVGVPLRTTTGVIIGTLCALDPVPRTIVPGTVELLEVFARRAVAEIERPRSPQLLAAVLDASSPRGDVYSSAVFRDLVAAGGARRARPAVLLSFRAASADDVLAFIDEHETAGRLGDATFGLLLPGIEGGAVDDRAARLRAAGAIEVRVAWSSEAPGVGAWTRER